MKKELFKGISALDEECGADGRFVEAVTDMLFDLESSTYVYFTEGENKLLHKGSNTKMKRVVDIAWDSIYDIKYSGSLIKEDLKDTEYTKLVTVDLISEKDTLTAKFIVVKSDLYEQCTEMPMTANGRNKSFWYKIDDYAIADRTIMTESTRLPDEQVDRLIKIIKQLKDKD